MSTLVGMCLNGRYRLDAQIGAGGMSTVYRAFDTTLERRVAVKLMHREIASDSDQLERFRREARSVAQLSHPHIVGVIDAGEEDGRPYIVFEYVEGETLKERIRRMGRLPIDEAIAYAIEIARALGAAHARAIVHRDIKPQNVLVDEEGSAKVTDFGIARSLEEEGLTADGRVLGTTDYVSPEQALGHDVDGQSDIYSLGVVLYEMLTGDVPFHGENQVSVAMKHVREDLPDVQVDAPRGLRPARRGARPHDREGPRPAPPRRGRGRGRPRGRARRRGLAHRHLDRRGDRGAAHAAGRRAPAAAAAAAAARARAAARPDDRGGRRRASTCCSTRPPSARSAGTGAGHEHAAPGEQIVSVKRTSANDYDPLGDDKEEHPERGAARRRPGLRHARGRPRRYQNDTLNKPTGDEPGVGLYVDAEPSVNGRSLEIQTPDARLDDGDLRRALAAARRVAERRLDAARRRHGRAAASRASSSTPATAATATTSSGSPRCRRTRTRSRSRSSR